MSDCSKILPNDVWCFIGEKLHLTVDRIRFRSVCRTWRSLLPFPQPPWLMLAEDEHTPNTRGFFGLGQQQSEEQVVYQFEFPEVYHTRCLGSIGTWLVIIDLQQRIPLIHPFSRLQFHLPPQTTLEYGPEKEYQIEPEHLRDAFIWKIILSSSSPQHCIAMAIHQCNRRLAIARLGHPSWTTVQTPLLKFVDAIFYKNKFYAINIFGILVVCNLDETPPVANTLTDIFKEKDETYKLYLVEWSGELMLVIKFMHHDFEEETYSVDKFKVYTFDFISTRWNELKDLGVHSLFLGINSSVAILAMQHSGLKRNCIYFTDDYTHGYRGHGTPGGRDMGVFDLEDESVRLHYKGVSTSMYSPPLWIVPR